ncbi:MAG: branched-chain amino acid ABC transporter permease [Candidatus Cloacimonetes bacterium]|nr:branched-chain amino acid ABC transporter permease [Candidatus Cloacimonadota bacterium]MCK9515595.1 branched-chain amino acid ABC transporter permease [Ottowia sp.]
MTLDLLLLQLFTGVALGAIYILLAVGLSLIFGLLTVVNFAHGAFYMVGAYVGVAVLLSGGNFWLGILAAPLVVGALGCVTERWLIRPLYGRGIDYPILLTFGLSYVLLDLIRMLFGVEGIPLEVPGSLEGAADLGFGYFPLYRLFVIAICAVLLWLLWLLLERSTLGLVIRAGARDPEMVRVLGVDVDRIRLLVFGLGTGVAALAGILAAPMRSVTPEMGIPVLVEAFVVTVVGGMGSLSGAVVAGLLVGVIASIVSLFYPEMSEMSMFFIMALVLLIRPQGIFGRAGFLE